MSKTPPRDSLNYADVSTLFLAMMDQHHMVVTLNMKPIVIFEVTYVDISKIVVKTRRWRSWFILWHLCRKIIWNFEKSKDEHRRKASVKFSLKKKWILWLNRSGDRQISRLPMLCFSGSPKNKQIWCLERSLRRRVRMLSTQWVATVIGTRHARRRCLWRRSNLFVETYTQDGRTVASKQRHPTCCLIRLTKMRCSGNKGWTP